MSELYDQVAALDRGIADRWKSRTHDDATHKLTPDDVDAIVSPLFKRKEQGDFITEKQGEAIVKLVQTTDFAKGGADRLRHWVNIAQDAIRLEMTPLVSDADLAPIYTALAMANSILFTSPGTKIAYSGHHYMGIAKLIKDSQIRVFRANIGELEKLTSAQGLYYSSANILMLYSPPSNPKFKPLVVHESTHAIQDWLDVRTQVRFSEADAYIAQVSLMDDDKFGDKFADTVLAASRFVRDRKATPGNKDWQRAYDAVIKAYEADFTNGRDLDTFQNQGETESAQYKAVLDAIDKEAQEATDFVVGVLKDSGSDIFQGLNSILP